MYRRPPKSIPSDTLFPYPNRFRSNEVLLAIVDHGFGAEAHAGGAFFRRACCRKDAGAEHAPKLDRRGADAARAAIDQQRFAAFQEIGRAHDRTPVTNAHLVCRLLLAKTHMLKQKHTETSTYS